MKKRKLVPVFAWIFVGIIVTAILVVLHFPLILGSASINAQEGRLDNPYINDGYADWREETFFDGHCFSLPGSWHIAPCNDFAFAVYMDDDIIAYVWEFGEGSDYAEAEDFCAAALNIAETDMSFEPFGSEFFGNGCYTYMIDVSAKEEYYCLLADTTERRCGVVFLNDSIEQDALLDYVIAIGYSYKCH